MCKSSNSSRHGDNDDDDDDDHDDDDDDDESWWSAILRVDCLTDRAPEVVLCLMWINLLFFFLQAFLIVFLNVVDTRAILVD